AVLTSLSTLSLHDALPIFYPPVGLALLLIMTVIALAASGVQVVMAGIRGRHRAPPAADRSLLHYDSDDQSLLAHDGIWKRGSWRSEEHTSELQSRENLVCR